MFYWTTEHIHVLCFAEDVIWTIAHVLRSTDFALWIIEHVLWPIAHVYDPSSLFTVRQYVDVLSTGASYWANTQKQTKLVQKWLGVSPETRPSSRIFDRFPGRWDVGIHSTTKGALMLPCADEPPPTRPQRPSPRTLKRLAHVPQQRGDMKPQRKCLDFIAQYSVALWHDVSSIEHT